MYLCGQTVLHCKVNIFQWKVKFHHTDGKWVQLTPEEGGGGRERGRRPKNEAGSKATGLLNKTPLAEGKQNTSHHPPGLQRKDFFTRPVIPLRLSISKRFLSVAIRQKEIPFTQGPLRIPSSLKQFFHCSWFNRSPGHAIQEQEHTPSAALNYPFLSLLKAIANAISNSNFRFLFFSERMSKALRSPFEAGDFFKSQPFERFSQPQGTQKESFAG